VPYLSVSHDTRRDVWPPHGHDSQSSEPLYRLTRGKKRRRRRRRRRVGRGRVGSWVCGEAVIAVAVAVAVHSQHVGEPSRRGPVRGRVSLLPHTTGTTTAPEERLPASSTTRPTPRSGGVRGGQGGGGEVGRVHTRGLEPGDGAAPLQLALCAVACWGRRQRRRRRRWELEAVTGQGGDDG